MIKNEYNVIGVMSGTSLDGIDMIYTTLVFDDKWRYTIHFAETFAYPKHWITILKNLTNTLDDELLKIDYKYSKYLAETINNFILKHNIKTIDFVASHGHTALHQPQKGITYQIGNQQVLAHILQKKVICDFRVQDVALGGQGAPLVPIGDKLLFLEYDYCINLGGFANISYDENGERIAFDICPVNIVLNHYVSKLGYKYDDKGINAKRGQINTVLLAALNQLEFYKTQAPKSLGYEWVQNNIFPLINKKNLNFNDVLRTFSEHIAIQISKVISKKSSTVLITGGGAYNKFLIQRIKTNTIANIVIPSKTVIEFKEALIFALLGVLRDRQEVNCLQSVTGASKNHSSGKIIRF